MRDKNIVALWICGQAAVGLSTHPEQPFGCGVVGNVFLLSTLPRHQGTRAAGFSGIRPLSPTSRPFLPAGSRHTADCLPRSPFLTAHSFGLWGDRRSGGSLVSHCQASPGVVLVKSLFLAHSGWLLLSAFPSKAMTDSDPPCLLLLLSSCVSQRVGRGAGASPLGRRHRPCLTLRSRHYGLARLHLFLSADRRPRPPLSLLASSSHRPPAFVRDRFIHTLQGANHATHQRHQQ